MASASESVVNQPAAAFYDALLLDHIKNARNYRVPERRARALTGFNALCGDDITLYLALENERIEEITFQCSCCGICMASASVMTELMTGRSRGDTTALLRNFIAALGRPEDTGAISFKREQQAILEAARKYPSRVRCASLPWTTLQTAFE
jgi:nitrogen fixation NifU-like protein